MDLLLIIILTNLVVYFCTLRYELVYDALYTNHKELEKRKFELKYYWEILQGKVSHYNIEIEHLLNIIQHTVNCSLIYLVFGTNMVSFMAAMFFAVNPYNSQCSIVTSNKTYTRYLTLLLLSWNTIFFIPILLLSYYMRFKMIHERYRINVTTPFMREISLRKIAIPFKCLTHYTLSCLIPYSIGPYSNFLCYYGLTEKESIECLNVDIYFLIGLLLIVCSPFSPWTLACVCILIPFLNYPYTMSQTIAPRYTYSFNAWLMFILAGFCNWYGFTAIMAAYLTRLVIHMESHRNYDLYLNSNNYYFNAPNNVSLSIVKGDYEKQTKDAFTVLATYINGTKQRKHDNRLNHLIGEVCMRIGLIKQAIHHLEIAENNKLDVGCDITEVTKKLKKACLDAIERNKAA